MTRDITSIEQLIDCFDEAPFSEQASILKRINIPTSDFENYATWTDEGYTRNCITRQEGFEFILLCWSPGAETAIHDHAGQHCWVYQVNGTVREKRYQRNDAILDITSDMHLDAGKLCYMHDRMGYHTLANESNQRSMTLHIYANPIDRCQIYNKEDERFEVTEMQYDTIEGEVVRSTGS